uniref:Uncharacterized protein n=1 Tax=Entomoneis paludosa TaxID=265537 RepID=A0A7S2YCP8_9STRA|mmetsp:Transcript_27297/g.57189  ORF Transcript_27297/g.57189 Transcript_27297/m.57189 type:complete len:251 (+) Transcript_27297:75-827(+)
MSSILSAATTVMNSATATSPEQAPEMIMQVLRSPIVEVAATLFTICYPLGVVLSLHYDPNVSGREWKKFRKGAELGALFGFLMQQLLCSLLVLLQYETASLLFGTVLGAVIYSPAIIPILSMVCLLVVTCPLACKTHTSMNLFWIGALCTALVQQGLWMALSLGFFFSGKNNLNMQGVGGYSNMAWVLLLGLMPLLLMKLLRQKKDSDDSKDQEEDYSDEDTDSEDGEESESEEESDNEEEDLLKYQRMV